MQPCKAIAGAHKRLDAQQHAAGAPQAQLAPPQVLDRRIRSSPLVRKIAKSTASICAGCRDRVQTAASPRKIFCATSRTAAPQAISAQSASQQVVKPKAEAPQPKVLTADIVPLTKMRAIIAQRMVESERTSPHVYSVYKIDMTRIARLRERERAGFEQRHGVKLTYMPFIAAAAVEALRQFPIVNASLIDNAIHYHANINLGIAVALEWGLIVPTVREAEKRDFASSHARSTIWPDVRAPRS